VIENGFGNLDLWAVESFGKVMEILTAQGVRTLTVALSEDLLVGNKSTFCYHCSKGVKIIFFLNL
jgi:hypothetical protein